VNNRVAIPPQRLGESPILGANGNSPFNFISLLAPAETLSTAVVTATVYSGLDPNPSTIIAASATIAGQQVQQKLNLATAGVLGVIYDLACSVTTNLGQTLRLCGYLAIIPDLP
jgi:hypothetical protein